MPLVMVRLLSSSCTPASTRKISVALLPSTVIGVLPASIVSILVPTPLNSRTPWLKTMVLVPILTVLKVIVARTPPARRVAVRLEDGRTQGARHKRIRIGGVGNDQRTAGPATVSMTVAGTAHEIAVAAVAGGEAVLADGEVGGLHHRHAVAIQHRGADHGLAVLELDPSGRHAGAGSSTLTIAVNVTVWPRTAGLGLAVSAVCVEAIRLSPSRARCCRCRFRRACRSRSTHRRRRQIRRRDGGIARASSARSSTIALFRPSRRRSPSACPRRCGLLDMHLDLHRLPVNRVLRSPGFSSCVCVRTPA